MADPLDDPIQPVEIAPSIDEVRVEGRSVQRYNFFDYPFQHGNA